MKYVRIHEDQNGRSHFDDVEVQLNLVEFAPPAPPLNVSDVSPATGMGFVTFPVGWRGD